MAAQSSKPGPAERDYRATWRVFTDLAEIYEPLNQQYTQENPLAANAILSAREVDNRYKQIDGWIRQHLTGAPQIVHDEEDNDMQDITHLSRKTVEKVARYFMVYNHQTIFNTLRFFDEGTTNNMRVFCIERNASKRKGERRSPFDIKQITGKLKCSLPPEYCRALCGFKSSGAKMQKGTWALHMDDSGRGLFVSIALFILNYTSAFIASALENNEDRASRQKFIRLMKTLETVTGENDGEEEVHMRYDAPTREEFTLDAIYMGLQERILDIGSQVVYGLIDRCEEDRWDAIKPKKGGVRRVLKVNRIITGREIAEEIFTDEDYCARLCIVFCEYIFRVAVLYDVITPDHMYYKALTVNMARVISEKFSDMCRQLIDCIDGLGTAAALVLKQAIEERLNYCLLQVRERRANMEGTTGGILLYDDLMKERSKHPGKEEVKEESDTESVVHGTIPPRGKTRAGPSTSGPVHVCVSCEQVWPPNLPWPPPKTKVMNGKRVTIVDAEVEEASPTPKTRSKKRRLQTTETSPEDSDTTIAPNNNDLLDLISNGAGRTNEVRLERVNTVVDEIYDRAVDIPGLVAAIQQRLEERVAATEAARVAREQEQAARVAENAQQQAVRATTRQQTLEQKNKVRAKRQRATRQKRKVQAAKNEQKDEQLNREAAAIRPTRNAPATNDRTIEAVLNAPPPPGPDDVVEPPEPPPLPNPPRLPPNHVPVPVPPEAPSAHRHYRTPVCHDWIPERYGTQRLRDFYGVRDIIALWQSKFGKDGPFDEGTGNTPQTFIDAIQLRKTGNHNYTTAMPTVFHSVRDYIQMWTAVVAVAVYNILYDIATAEASWARVDPDVRIVYDNPGFPLGAAPGPDGYVITLLPDAEHTLILEKDMDGPAGDGRIVPVRYNDVVLVRVYQVQRRTPLRRGAPAELDARHVTTYLGVVRNVNARHIGAAMGEHAPRHHVRNTCTVTVSVVGYPTNEATGARLPGINRAVDANAQVFIGSIQSFDYLGNFNRSIQGLRQLTVNPNNRVNSIVTNNVLPAVDATPLNDWEERFARDSINTEVPREVGNLAQARHHIAHHIEKSLDRATSTRMERYIEHFLQTPYEEPEAVREHNFNGLSWTQALAVAAVTYRGPQYEPVETGGLQQQRNALTNIVGPPGTGKTRTLIHCVSAILDEHYETSQGLIELRATQCAYSNGGRVTPDNTRVSTDCIDRAVNMNAPRILILTPTHRALDVIETKFLEDRIYAYDAATHQYRNVVPPYRRLGLNNRADNNAILNALREASLPAGYTTNPNMCVTLSTMGSLHLAFDRDAPAEANLYDYILIDEASQVSEVDMHSLYNELLRVHTGEHAALPKICKFGDPMQLPPMAHGIPSMYRLIMQCSPLERELPDETPGLPGRNSVTCVVLCEQYRMHSHVSRLANILSQRNVQTRMIHTNQYVYHQINPIIRRYQGYMENVGEDNLLRNPVVFFDAYYRAADLQTTQIFNDLHGEFGDGDEHSLHEACFILRILREVHNRGMVPLENILILTIYNDQRNLLVRAIERYLGDLTHRQGNNPGFNPRTQISTVDSAQGKEAYMVLFSPAKWAGPNGNNAVNQNSLLNSLREIYVMVSRAQRHLYITGDHLFLRNNCPAWRPLCDFVQNNNPI